MMFSRDALLRAYQADRLGHSYLFVGPDGVGKKRFALASPRLSRVNRNR
ncbi:MAG: hypothetical protein QM703_25000 [Gemmatales bacterium]